MKKKKLLINLITYAIVTAAFIICNSLIEQRQMSRFMQSMLVPICCYIVLAISLNLTVGISGELSLGHAGFMAIGAFGGMVLSTWLAAAAPDMSKEIRLLFAVLAGGVLAMAAGALVGIPVLRLRGDYLAIVTLAFGEIIRNVLNMVYISRDGTQLHFAFGNSDIPGKIIMKGAAGLTGVQKLSSLAAGFILIVFTLFVVQNLVNSRSGRAIMAARDNRIAAESMGISITKYKMMAFVTSAALAGMAGALFGLNYTSLQPAKFNIDTSIQILVFVVMGGIGNILGSVIAAAVLYILPELLRDYSQYRMLIYAVLLILMMLLSNNPMIRSLLRRMIPRKKDRIQEEGGIRA